MAHGRKCLSADFCRHTVVATSLDWANDVQRKGGTEGNGNHSERLFAGRADGFECGMMTRVAGRGEGFCGNRRRRGWTGPSGGWSKCLGRSGVFGSALPTGFHQLATRGMPERLELGVPAWSWPRREQPRLGACRAAGSSSAGPEVRLMEKPASRGAARQTARLHHPPPLTSHCFCSAACLLPACLPPAFFDRMRHDNVSVRHK